jgi:hypothetical protein
MCAQLVAGSFAFIGDHGAVINAVGLHLGCCSAFFASAVCNFFIRAMCAVSIWTFRSAVISFARSSRGGIGTASAC